MLTSIYAGVGGLISGLKLCSGNEKSPHSITMGAFLLLKLISFYIRL